MYNKILYSDTSKIQAIIKYQLYIRCKTKFEDYLAQQIEEW